ncbi:MAG TPA: 5-(carboxyamino)imidazole ribonucleotide synthase [Trueperaceae bacterium]
MEPLLPGATIGVLGSGQLGRMLAFAAHRMGYRIAVYSPGSDTPAGGAADLEMDAQYEDEDALARFAGVVDVVTVEFENIPSSALELLERSVPVRPGPAALHITQNRRREKEFLARHGLPHARAIHLNDPAELDRALAAIGTPAVLKTAGFGYDGKGQLMIAGNDDRAAAAAQAEAGPCVLEEFVEFEREVSVLVARTPDGEMATCGPIENRHAKHVLDLSTVPARLATDAAQEARDLARDVAVSLELVGLACVEMFVTAGGGLLVNEIAPRPHNSGHLTIEACVASQFEQQLRSVCGLPLAGMEFVRPAAMANLLGDLWHDGEPDWTAALRIPGVALHLYGKERARPGRKMGHITALADTPEAAARRALEARAALGAANSLGSGGLASPRT